jgi:hypothetical protein
MRAKEFITEQRVALSVDIARALPGTYTIPGLPNNDFYKQYRFGVALAGARGQIERAQDSIPPYNFEKETPWGENMIVSSYMDGGVDKDIDYAMRETGVEGGKVLISTMKSEEATDVVKSSPVKAFKGYKRK